MRLNRPQGAATDGVQTAGVVRRRLRASAIRVLSVTAVAAATCSLWAGVASAATAHTKHATTTSVSVSPKTAFVGEIVKLGATVSGGKTPTGKVTFKIDGIAICSVKLSRGKASCRVIGGDAATFHVRAFYAGNSTHKASSSGVANLKEIRAKTTTKITNRPNPGSVDVGGKFTFNVTVASQAGAPAANGTVRVRPTEDLPAAYSCNAKVTNGKGKCTITPPAYGIDDYTAKFVGNSADKSSTYKGPFGLAVQNVTTTSITATSTTVGDITLTTDVYAMGANITGGNKGTGSVTVYIGTSPTNVAPIAACAGQLLTTFTGAPANDNVYTCTGVAALNDLPAGTYYISAVFSGDPVNVGSNSNPPTAITIG
jgi:hypothetical protein